MDSWQIQLDAPNAAVRFQAPDNDKFYLICYLYIYRTYKTYAVSEYRRFTAVRRASGGQLANMLNMPGV